MKVDTSGFNWGSLIHFIEMPGDLMTDKNGTSRRLRVDVGQTGFFAGRSFRTFYEFSLTAGTSRTFKIVTPVNTIIEGYGFTTDASTVKLYTIAGDATEGGTFNVTLPKFGANQMTERPTPYYESQLAVTTGGTATGGTTLDALVIKTSNNTNQASTSDAISQGERGIPPGTYYLRLDNVGADTANILVKARWEERVP